MLVALGQYDGPTTMRALPLAAGLLAATAKQRIADLEITIVTDRRPFDEAISALGAADVAAFSLYAWNERYTLEVVRQLRKRQPAARIVVGGPSVPRRDAAAFMAANPAVDALVVGEGELAFAELLEAYRDDNPLDEVDGVLFRRDGAIVRTAPRARIADFRATASPYLDGSFDDLAKGTTNALIETNRGCPFSCTFCDWGQATASRVHELPLERVLDELAWMAARGVRYIYVVDANFGIRRRDIDIVEAICDLKRRTGLPDFVYFHLTKNAHRKNLATVERLRAAGIGCQVALSMQDFDGEVLEAIKRDNISLPKSLSLRQACADQHIPTFNELLLGLPAQTYDSFCNSVVAALTPYPSDTFFLYLVRLLENAEMASPEHRARYGLETRWCVSTAQAGRATIVDEFEEVVVATSTMSVNDWRRAFAFGYVVAATYNLRLLDVVMRYLRSQNVPMRDWVEAILGAMTTAAPGAALHAWLAVVARFTASILDGGPLLLPMAAGGPRPREPADALVIAALAHRDAFYREVEAVTRPFVEDHETLAEVFRYQGFALPKRRAARQEASFTHDWFGFHTHEGAKPPLVRRATELVAEAPDYAATDDDVAFFDGYLAAAYSKTGAPRIWRRGEVAPPTVSLGVADPHARGFTDNG